VAADNFAGFLTLYKEYYGIEEGRVSLLTEI
jgi:hypothetical protein